MTNSTLKAVSPGVVVGVDLGDRFSQLFVLDRATGEVLEESRLPTTRRAFEQRFNGRERMRIAMEVGTHSRWVATTLAEAGHEVLVANPRKLKLITESDDKSDKTDAEMLARLATADPALLSPIRHRSDGCQADLALLKARDLLVQSRTKVVNSVRGLVKSAGSRLPSCAAKAFHRRVRDLLPDALVPAVEPLLELLASLEAQIKVLERRIKDRSKEAYPEVEVLQQVPGVGPLTALAFVLTLESPERFPNGRAVASYVGLRPRRQQSGARDPQLRITKAGNGLLRRLLVGSAAYALGPFGPDTDLRRWGQKLDQRGGRGSTKRAQVAVARKLAVLLHRLWRTGEAYEPLKNARRQTA